MPLNIFKNKKLGIYEEKVQERLGKLVFSYSGIEVGH
jgi:hypothetical protein